MSLAVFLFRSNVFYVVRVPAFFLLIGYIEY